jgi:hypothetical protein
MAVNKLPTVEIAISGVQCKMVLDTGTSVNILSPEVFNSHLPQTEVNVQNILQSLLVLLLFDLECSSFVLINHPTLHLSSLATISMSQHLSLEVSIWWAYFITMCSNSLTIGRFYTKFLSCIHLIRVHYILPGFFIWPTFQGHGGQTLKFLRSAPTDRADLHQIFIMDTSNKDISHVAGVFDLTYFSMSQRKNWNFYDT